MLEFKNVGFGSADELKKYFEYAGSRLCDYSAGVTLMWRNYFGYRYAVYNDTLILEGDYSYAGRAFCMPVGKDPQGALDALEAYCASLRRELRFANIGKNDLPLLLERYVGAQPESDRDWADYLYLASDLAEFSGKRYHGQKNHKNRFYKLYKDAAVISFSELSDAELSGFFDAYFARKDASDPTFAEDKRICGELVSARTHYGFFGVALKVGGQTVGVALGEKIKDTLYEHTEKALTEYSGVYPALISAFAQCGVKLGAKYINREEDAGSEGLRISKLALHPTELLEKYTLSAGFLK